MLLQSKAARKVSSPGAYKGSNDGMFILLPLEKTGFIDNKYQLDQYVQILNKYLESHPKNWDDDASTLIEYALWDAFPQKKE